MSPNSAQNELRHYRSSFFQQFAAQVEKFLVRATYSSFSRPSHILLIFSSDTPRNSRPSKLIEMLICRTSFTKHINFSQICPSNARFSKIICICKGWTFKKDIIGRTSILRWLWRENEENVARTRNCCGWPSYPP